MPTLRIALAQTNPIMGAFVENMDAAVDVVARARAEGADLVALGEMALSGYPIEDLAPRPAFLRASAGHVRQLAERLEAEGLGDIPVVIGSPDGPFDARPEDRGTS